MHTGEGRPGGVGPFIGYGFSPQPAMNGPGRPSRGSLCDRYREYAGNGDGTSDAGPYGRCGDGPERAAPEGTAGLSYGRDWKGRPTEQFTEELGGCIERCDGKRVGKTALLKSVITGR